MHTHRDELYSPVNYTNFVANTFKYFGIIDLINNDRLQEYETCLFVRYPITAAA